MEQKEEIKKDHEESFRVTDTFTILTEAMVLQVCTYIKRHQIVRFKYERYYMSIIPQ